MTENVNQKYGYKRCAGVLAHLVLSDLLNVADLTQEEARDISDALRFAGHCSAADKVLRDTKPGF